MAFKTQKLIDKLENLIDTVEKLTDEISLICIEARNKIDDYNEKTHTEEFPELDHFNNIDEKEDK